MERKGPAGEADNPRGLEDISIGTKLEWHGIKEREGEGRGEEVE